jgi:cell division septation protein DedD
LASHAQDDGFHEIQLNGKQLVFLFMAATVISVVIFLLGVLVGRGARAELGTTVANSGLDAPSAELPAAPPAATPTPAGSDPTAAAPPPAVDDLSYFKRLEKQTPAPEQLKAATGRPAQGVAEKPAAQTPRAEPAVAPPSDSSARPWAVQVAALNVRAEADAVAKRLASKGYAAYVVAPADGATVYRVRVGKFGTRDEAEPLKAKLENEEQFKPWITR